MGSQIKQNHKASKRKMLRAVAGSIVVASFLSGCDEPGKFVFPTVRGATAYIQSAPSTRQTI